MTGEIRETDIDTQLVLDISDILDNDIEWFNDMVAMQLTQDHAGVDDVTDIRYEVESSEGDVITFRVWGDPV